MTTTRLTQSLLSHGIALALLAPGAARAQAASPPGSEAAEDLETVIVSGVRASLSKSVELKRAAGTVQDSISAVELGKFPDDNVADSLSHITGVAISRTAGGEGQKVSVRGLGPEYTLTTFNNRILATDGAGRDFAYDVLPADIKTRLAGKRASHSYMGRLLARKASVGLTREIPADHAEKMPPLWHPVFRTHPVTGRKSIYVTEGECTAIEGIADDEALELIAQLHRLVIEPRFHYRHRWQRGDVIMWDNCTCQHLAVRDYGDHQRRLMHRVSVDGSIPF